MWLGVGFTVLLVIVGGALLEFGENGRFRAMVDPLIVALTLGSLASWARRTTARQAGHIVSAAVIDARARRPGYCRHPWVGSGGAHAEG